MRKLSMLAALVAALLATPALGQNSPSTPTSALRPIDRRTTGTVTAANTCAATGFGGGTSCIQHYASGMGSAVITLSGAFTGTLAFFVMTPDGTWTATTGIPVSGGAPVASVTAAGSWVVSLVGFQGVEVNCTAFTSSPTISIESTPAQFLTSASAALLAAQRGDTAQLTTEPGQWGIQQTPAVATQATISRAAGAAGVRHVAATATVCIVATAAQAALAFNLRDGATGAGTILWSVSLSAAAGTGQCVSSPPFNLVGTAATAMTLESSAAPAATNFASVSLTGYDVL